jgi:hypothetical protein
MVVVRRLLFFEICACLAMSYETDGISHHGMLILLSSSQY